MDLDLVMRAPTQASWRVFEKKIAFTKNKKANIYVSFHCNSSRSSVAAFAGRNGRAI